jgi:HEAT repeat protein
MGPAAAEAVRELSAVLADEYSEVAGRAASALGQIGPPAKEAIPALTAALKHADRRLREAAAEALHQIDPEGTLKQPVR